MTDLTENTTEMTDNQQSNMSEQPKSNRFSLPFPRIQIQPIDVYVARLRLWALIVLPLGGYLLGQILQFVLKIKDNSKFQALLVHGITMGFLILIFDDILFNPNQDALKDLQSKVLFLVISYLFVLGLVLGIVF